MLWVGEGRAGGQGWNEQVQAWGFLSGASGTPPGDLWLCWWQAVPAEAPGRLGLGGRGWRRGGYSHSQAWVPASASAQHSIPSACPGVRARGYRRDVALCHLSALSAFPIRICWHPASGPGCAGTSEQPAGLSHSVWLIAPSLGAFPLSSSCSSAWIWVLVPLCSLRVWSLLCLLLSWSHISACARAVLLGALA